MTNGTMAAAIRLAAAGGLTIASPAVAQNLSSIIGEGTIIAGGGIRVAPSYPGARSTIVVPVILARTRRDGQLLPVRTPEQSPGFSLIGTNDAFSIGPIVAFQTARRNSDVPVPIGRVGFTVEPGAYVHFFPMPWLRLRGEVRHGIGGHRALLGDVEAAVIVRGRDDRFVATIGPRLRLAEDRYARTYFGVPVARSAATGLPAFDATGGATAASLAAGLLYQFNDRWGAYGFAGYERLLGDASDSPLVRAYGSRGRASGGVAVTYAFRRSGQR